MDTSDPDIVFDKNGYCNHCTNAIERLKQPPYGLPPAEKESALKQLIEKIKAAGKGKKYDCVIGLSGGVDSSYLAYLVKQWGLRPIAVHLDNHWNSEIAEQNISNICKNLGIEEKRIVINWDEFKDLQLAFLKASTPDSEIPSDNGIFAALWGTANEYNVKYILAGYNASSESILAKAWSQGYFDKTYIEAVYKRFGNIKKLSFHILSLWEILYNRMFRNMKLISTLDYLDYDKEQAKTLIKKELGWNDYGRKHGESTYTRIFQEYILPVKFGFDKRKAHFSSLIVAGQMSRDEALQKLSEPLYADKQSMQRDIDTLCNKFGITNEEFENIMNLPAKSINDYPNDYKTFRYKLFMTVKGIIKRIIGRK
jgi:N-acetyl sugar amidotransferase